jgi:hypothetical protein
MKKVLCCLAFLGLLAGVAPPANSETLTLNYQPVTSVGGPASLCDLDGLTVEVLRNWLDPCSPAPDYAQPYPTDYHKEPYPTVYWATEVTTLQFSGGDIYYGFGLPLWTYLCVYLPLDYNGNHPNYGNVWDLWPDFSIIQVNDALWWLDAMGLDSSVGRVSFDGGPAGVAFDAQQFYGKFLNPESGHNHWVSFANQLSMDGEIQDHLYSTLILTFGYFYGYDEDFGYPIYDPGLRTMAGFYEFQVGVYNVSYDFSVPAVPLPSALLLFGSGLLGLVGLRRFRKG